MEWALSWPTSWETSVKKSRKIKAPAHRENREESHSIHGASRSSSATYCQALGKKVEIQEYIIVLQDFLVQTWLLKSNRN